MGCFNGWSWKLAWIFGSDMRNFVFVAEGAHDVSFLGKLLVRNGFAKIENFEQIPPEWKILYPKKFPWDGEIIQRVARFPDLFSNNQIVVGLLNSGGDSKLITSLRTALDAIGPRNVELVLIFADADMSHAEARFTSLRTGLTALNAQAVHEGVPEFPIAVPSKIGTIDGANPAIGVFVFPDNVSMGSLEDVLYACATQTHPEVAERARDLVTQLDADLAAKHQSLKNLRAGLGKAKAKMGIVANILKPGTSLAVAVEQQSIIPEADQAPDLVKDINKFLVQALQR